MTGEAPAAGLLVDPHSPRTRRPLDVLVVGVGVVGAVVAARAADVRGPVESAAVDLAAALPSWTRAVFEALYVACAGYAVVVLLPVLRHPRRRAATAFTVLLAAGAAVAGVTGASLVAEHRLPVPELDLERRDLADQHFPVVGVAFVVAVLLVLRPWLVLSYRHLAGVLALILCLSAWGVGLGGPAEVLGALALGAGAAGAALLVLGSPAGHPDLAAVAASLEALGIPVTGLRYADEQPWGARVVQGTGESGRPLVVKVHGRDAVEANRAARAWRALAYREQTTPSASRLQLVEHEALVTLLAERAGVCVVPVVAAASIRGDALIVLEAPPRSFADLGDPLDDAAVSAMWAAVGRLHAAGLCHGDLGLHRIGPAPGGVVLWDFALGAVAASPARIAQDTAVLLASQARRTGADRAVAAAVTTLGAADVVAAQPYLQRAVLPRAVRGRGGEDKVLLESVRTAISERTGAPPAAPAPVVRIRPRDLGTGVLLVLAAYGLLTALGGLDWALVLDSWAQATWAWILIGVLVAQLTTVADSGSTMSVVATRLPLLPLVHVQYAVKLVGLAISSTVGKIGLNTAFLRRYGEGPSVAVAVTAADSLAGAVVNVVVSALALLLGFQTAQTLTVDTAGLGRLVVLVVVLVVLSLVVVAVVPPVRRRAVAVVAKGWAAIRTVATSPTRMLLLLGTNLVSLLITALSLSCMVQAIHPSLPFGTTVAVTALAGLFASVMPVPGNVGVAELAIATGLGLAGIPSAPAFAIAVTQRIATSYLQSGIGVFSLHWLRRQDYV